MWPLARRESRARDIAISQQLQSSTAEDMTGQKRVENGVGWIFALRSGMVDGATAQGNSRATFNPLLVAYPVVKSK